MLRTKPVAAALLGLLLAAACAPQPETGEITAMKKVSFGTAGDRAVDLYTLANRSGAEVSIATYGGIVTSLRVPDRAGNPGDVVLGFDSLEPYLKAHPYFGALVGRYGNRIAKGRFPLDGAEYTLARNDGENHLHGGLRGFDKAVWEARDVSTPEAPALELKHTSPDGDEGYPGNLQVTVVYTLTAANELRIDYSAVTDKPTVLNLTNHSYFNLAGQGTGDILGHEMQIFAGKFTPVDKGLIPTGELRPVEGTPFDFRQPVPIGARIDAGDEQIRLGGGYDHNFVLAGGGGSLAPAARVREPKTGRVMEVLTTEPGVQFYTGNFLDGTLTGKGGRVYQRRYGFCLETQHFPDSPNQPSFPPAALRPGQAYRSTTVFRFTTDSGK